MSEGDNTDLYDWATQYPERAIQSSREIRFFLQIVECRKCGHFAQQWVRSNWERSGRSSSQGTVTCPQCGRDRILRVVTLDLREKPEDKSLTISGPSQILQPHELLQAYDRYAAKFSVEPSTLVPDDFWAQFRIFGFAETCAYELVKFVPDGADRVPPELIYQEGREYYEAHPQRYTREYLQGLLDHVMVVNERYEAERPRADAQSLEKRGPPKVAQGGVGRLENEAHRQWLKRGRVGEGRMVVKHRTLTEQSISGVQYTGGAFEDVVFDCCKMARSTFDGATFTDCKFVGSNAENAHFHKCQFTRCVIDSGHFNMAEFQESELIDCTLVPIHLIYTDWSRAKLGNVDLRCAYLDHSNWNGALVENCNFNRSYLGRNIHIDNPFPMHGARFVDCDFRDSGWRGRDLSGATFVRCKFDGAWGPVTAHDGLVLEDCGMTVGEFIDLLAVNGAIQQAAEDAWTAKRAARIELLNVLQLRVTQLTPVPSPPRGWQW